MKNPHNLLSSKDYRIDVEKASGKVALVIRNNIEYIRRHDLEKEDSSIIIVDVNSKPKVCLINICLSFNPQTTLKP